jgi:hypothetical protein
VLDDGAGVFLTIGYFQRLLRVIRAPKSGQHCAAACLNQILLRLKAQRRRRLARAMRVLNTRNGGRPWGSPLNRNVAFRGSGVMTTVTRVPSSYRCFRIRVSDYL